jgi:hypothetical protein
VCYPLPFLVVCSDFTEIKDKIDKKNNVPQYLRAY